MRLPAVIIVVALTACTTARAPSPDPVVVPTAVASVPSATPTAEPTIEPPVKACTKMGCMDSLAIELSPAKLLAGKYSVTVAAGGKEATCKVTVPYPPCGTMATECAGTLPMMSNESGCELPKEQQKFPGLTIGEAPAEVTVTVKRGATKLTETKTRPAVSEYRPNGPECEPVCKSAKLLVEWK